MDVILYQPEIPQNTGNIARTCLATGNKLILIRPLGFNLSERQVRRAGLDYWDPATITVSDSLDPYLIAPCYFFSTRGHRPYTDIVFEPGAKLIFGSESRGLPQLYHEKWSSSFFTIPMLEVRSLNLANAVAIVVYEAWRQCNFSTCH